MRQEIKVARKTLRIAYLFLYLRIFNACVKENIGLCELNYWHTLARMNITYTWIKPIGDNAIYTYTYSANTRTNQFARFIWFIFFVWMDRVSWGFFSVSVVQMCVQSRRQPIKNGNMFYDCIQTTLNMNELQYDCCCFCVGTTFSVL